MLHKSQGFQGQRKKTLNLSMRRCPPSECSGLRTEHMLKEDPHGNEHFPHTPELSKNQLEGGGQMKHFVGTAGTRCSEHGHLSSVSLFW